jgi:hypothetical protein
MMKLLVGASVGAFAVAVVPAAAQPAPSPPPGVASGVAPAPASPMTPRTRTRMMVMSDKVMTRAEVSAHVGKLFAKFDTNRDGFVTRDEVEAIHQKMMGTVGMAGDTQKRMAERGIFMGDRGAVFDRLDTNHDGNISRQEFMTSHPQVRQERVMIMRDGGPEAPGEPGMKRRMHGGRGMGGFGGHLFDMADANKDGRVSLAEAQAAALAHFDKADVNHDGKITPDERQQMRKMRIERRQG